MQRMFFCEPKENNPIYSTVHRLLSTRIAITISIQLYLMDLHFDRASFYFDWTQSSLAKIVLLRMARAVVLSFCHCWYDSWSYGTYRTGIPVGMIMRCVFYIVRK